MNAYIAKTMQSTSRHDQMLALSGGGAWGAYGAGYLDTLFKRNPPADFTLVTGVSTGAVMATAAFLGDTKMLGLYAQIEKGQILKKKPLWVFSNSYVSTQPLRQLLTDQLTEETIRAVAEKVRDRNGVLLIGAYNLDTGSFRTFNLGKLALEILTADAQARDRVQRSYVDAVMASAAIPVAFPPVFVNCRMYVDGGVGHQIFIRDVAQSFQRESMRMADAAPSQAPPPRLLAIVNGRRALLEDLDGVDNGLIDIAARSVSGLLRSSVQNDLRILETYSRENPSTLTIESADDTQCNEPDDIFGFARDFMQCLYREGQEKANLRQP